LDSGIDLNALATEKATQTLWFVLVGTIITAIIWPIAEEFVFRGAIFTGLLGKLGFYPSMFISSFLFMIIHSPVQYLWAFVYGVMLVYVYHKTKNIAIVIILHIINNLVPSFLSIYDVIFPWDSWAQQELSLDMGVFIEWLQSMIPFVIIGCIFLFILIKKRWLFNYTRSF
jgi:membrane protease YdiL (CAAX protease family)